MKRALVAGVSVTSLAIGVISVAASQVGAHAAPGGADTHGFGLDIAASRAHGRVAEPKTFGAMKSPSLRAGAVPASADLSSFAQPAGQQGRVGSCVAWATGYTGYGILMNQQKISGGPMAPMYVYAQIAQGNDRGTWAGKALPIMQEQGIDTKAHYSPGDFDFSTQPTQAERDNASKYKLTGYQQLPTSGQAAKDAIMNAIANGSPVPFGIQLHQNFNNMDAQTASSYSYQPSGYAIGGHEMTIIGYNERGVKIMNSWGDSWGDKGTFTMPWSFLDTDDVTEIHAMGKVAGDNPNPTPGPNPTTSPTPGPNPTTSPTPGPNPTTSPTPGPNPTPQPGTAIVDVTSTNVAQVKALASERPVVFLITAPSWCAACQQLDPIIKKVANAGGGKWTLAIIDVDKAGGAEREFGATSYPTMIPYNAKGEMGNPQRFSGAGSESQVSGWIDQVISAYGPVPNPPAPTPGPNPPSPAPTPEPAPTTDPAPEPTADPVPSPDDDTPSPDDDTWWWGWYLVNGGDVSKVPSKVMAKIPMSMLAKAPSHVRHDVATMKAAAPRA